jgi:hypothetical protein
MWDPEFRVIDIIKSYQEYGQAVIDLRNEGPSADAVKLYSMLDYLCEQFNFDKKNITIVTANREELHSEYRIRRIKSHHITKLHELVKKNKWHKQDFQHKKDIFKNLFGCFYNIPSWDRLCLLAHIKYKTQHKSLLACNGTWTAHEHNSYYLDTVTDFCPTEFKNISQLIIDNIGPLPDHPGQKPDMDQNLDILKYYNEFFVDIVAETYTNGLTFFPTEKTFRPIYALTPFIVFGPQNFLSTLKSDYGFKSFDRWWDESYDNFQNYERIQEIYKVIDYIDKMSNADLLSMYQDMSEVLEFNHTRLCEINE